MMRPRHSHMGKLAFEIVCTADAAHSSLSHSHAERDCCRVRRLINVHR